MLIYFPCDLFKRAFIGRLSQYPSQFVSCYLLRDLFDAVLLLLLLLLLVVIPAAPSMTKINQKSNSNPSNTSATDTTTAKTANANTNSALKVKRTRKTVPRDTPPQRSSIYRGVTRWDFIYFLHV